MSIERVLSVPMLAELLRLPVDHRRRRAPETRLELRFRLAFEFEFELVISLLSPKMPPAMMSTESVLALPMLAELLRLPVDHRRRRPPDIRPEFRFRLAFEFELVIVPLSPKMPPAMISTERVLASPMLAELLRAPWDWITIFLAKMLGVSVAVFKFKLSLEIIETRFVVLVPMLAELLRLRADCRDILAPCKVPDLNCISPYENIERDRVLSVPMLAKLVELAVDCRYKAILAPSKVPEPNCASCEYMERDWVLSVPMLAELVKLPSDRISMSTPFKVVSDCKLVSLPLACKERDWV